MCILNNFQLDIPERDSSATLRRSHPSHSHSHGHSHYSSPPPYSSRKPPLPSPVPSASASARLPLHHIPNSAR